MPTLETSSFVKAPRVRGSRASDEVLNNLRELCLAMQPGDVVPTHTELMRQFNASERSILWALGELRRQGIINRRPGAPTVVASHETSREFSPEPAPTSRVTLLNGHILEGDGTPSVSPTKSQSIVAITQPDNSIYDRALQLLSRQSKVAKIRLRCELLQESESEEFAVEHEHPLGFVVFRSLFAPLARRLQEEGHRVVLVGTPRVAEELGVPNVYSDQEEGGYLVAKHLVELGHRHILLGNADSRDEFRWRGVDRAFGEARDEGMQVQTTELTHAALETWVRDPLAVREYFLRSGAPTAIVTWNDHDAIRLLTLLQGSGVRVPDDVSLVGYDNLPHGATLHPALTTVDIGIERQVSTALRLLTQDKTPNPQQSLLVLPNLVRRDSSAPIAA